MSIGNFDGVHRGHVALIAAARAAVGTAGRVIVLAFDPHPLTVLRPDRPRDRLTTFDERRAALLAVGADHVVRLRPTRDLLELEPEAFVARMQEEHEAAFIVEGTDFRFGRRRTGSVETLRALEAAYRYRTIVVDPVEAPLANQHVVTVSSTLIRWLLRRGRVADAARLLGRPYALGTAVVRGDQRGRTIGMPTANLDATGRLLPADGIYAGRARHGRAGWFPAAISVGTKPTFGASPRTCEAHLIGFDGPLDDYGWTIQLEFTHWLRGQVRYDGAPELVAQLHRDVEAARSLPGVAA